MSFLDKMFEQTDFGRGIYNTNLLNTAQKIYIFGKVSLLKSIYIYIQLCVLVRSCTAPHCGFKVDECFFHPDMNFAINNLGMVNPHPTHSAVKKISCTRFSWRDNMLPYMPILM